MGRPVSRRGWSRAASALRRSGSRSVVDLPGRENGRSRSCGGALLALSRPAGSGGLASDGLAMRREATARRFSARVLRGVYRRAAASVASLGGGGPRIDEPPVSSLVDVELDAGASPRGAVAASRCGAHQGARPRRQLRNSGCAATDGSSGCAATDGDSGCAATVGSSGCAATDGNSGCAATEGEPTIG